jgi:hypothetical protein
MKKTTLLIILICFAFACKKSTPTSNNNNSTPPLASTFFDTTISVNFVIQAVGAPYTNIHFASIGFTSSNINSAQAGGSTYNLNPSPININYCTAGDTSHINYCSAITYINESMKFSKSNIAHFEIQISSTNGFQNAQFDYNPATKKFTSFIYPVNTNMTNQDTVHPILVANTGYSLNCVPGKWVIYCKF